MRILVLIGLLMLSFVDAAATTRALLHHDLDVRLEPESAGLSVIDRVRFAEGSSDDRGLSLLLHRDLAVAEVRFGDEVLAVETLRRWRPRDFFDQPDYAELGAYRQARQHVVAAPAEGWPAGEIELEFHYSGAVYDSLHEPEVAYGRGFESTSGLIDPRGAFLSFETFWVPWTGEGRFHFRLRTVLPEGWQSMSQGRRAHHEQSGGMNTSVWETEAPQELIYLVAGPYTIREREHEGVSLYTYTYSDTPEDLCATYLDAAARYLDLYGDRIAPYGFSKWAMVENWWQTGFGMPGFTLLGDRVIRLPFIVDTSYGHEILHCWWGNGVYVDYESGNWCEGLTAYGADYAYKLEQGDDHARDYRRDTLTGYLDFASSETRDFPLREFRERSDFGTQAIGYGKCLMVFHMLEDRVGTELFDEGLREFYERFEFTPASWDDIANVFSEVSGEDLEPWFLQWIERTGAARISIGAVEELDGGWQLRVDQTGEPFALDVPVTWVDAAGEHSTRVALDGASATVQFPASLRSVAVDPDYDLFRVVLREEIPATLSQILGADSTLVVIGRDTETEMRAELLRVAEGWAENQDMRIVVEEDLAPADLQGRSLFLLGPGSLVDAAFVDAGAALGGAPQDLRDQADGKSLIVCFRDAGNPQLAQAVVLPADAAVVEALGRKMPHYSRYSWLLFEGEQNTGKGAWTVLTSPLRRTLEATE
jgi:hypothetical protein